MGYQLAMNAKPYQPEVGRIVFTTKAKGLASHVRALARQTPAEVKAADEVMSVVKAQPHRRGNASSEASYEPLGRCCASWWPNDQSWGQAMYRAGCQFDEVVRDSLIGLGLTYIGQSGGNGDGSQMTDEQLQARKELATMRRNKAEDVLRMVYPSLPGAMVRLCYDKLEPSPYDEGKLKNGLYALADLWKIVKRGINEGKSA